MNTPSERSMQMLNNEMNNSTTKVYLKDGKTLKKGTFHIISDSLVHVTPNLIKKYHISKIKSIRTVGNHSSSTFMGISMVVGGVIMFDSVFEGNDIKRVFYLMAQEILYFLVNYYGYVRRFLVWILKSPSQPSTLRGHRTPTK